jgi:signal transduction histidine kinase
MAADQVATQSGNVFISLQSLAKAWLEPRSTDRDEAFRERSTRIAIALVIMIGVISFFIAVFIFKNEWKLISFPTLHIPILVGFFAAAYAVTRRQVTVSANLVIATTLIAAAGYTILAEEESAFANLIVGPPLFMTVILIGAMVLSRKTILPMTIVASIFYGLALLSNRTNLATLPTLVVARDVSTSIILFLVEGVILQRLRVEFDARLDAMRDSIQQAELAKQQAEEARQQAEIQRRRAEESDKAKSQFLANMSHELRTPLNAIIGYDEAMLGGLAGEFTTQQIKLLGNIQYNSRRLLGLINDILDLAKIESGSLQVFLSPMSPHKVIRETAESVRSLADNKNIYLNVQISDDVPEIVLGDANKLQQIFVNLLSNAIKFTDNGGVTVNVQILDSNHWQVRVRDTGIGMNPDGTALIFEPFQQLDNTDKRKYKGTGLGLAITQRLVQTLGGTIEVESKLGEGSTFSVRLPRAHIPMEAVNEIENIPN